MTDTTPTAAPTPTDTSLHLTRTGMILAGITAVLTLWPAEQAIEHAHGKPRIVAEADAAEQVMALLAKAGIVGPEITDAVTAALESVKAIESSPAPAPTPSPAP